MVGEYSDLHGGAFKLRRLSLWVLLVPPPFADNGNR